jgi:hypothetical protein
MSLIAFPLLRPLLSRAYKYVPTPFMAAIVYVALPMKLANTTACNTEER